MQQQTKTEKIRQDFGQYIVSPASAFGLAGFVFDVAKETEQSSTNEITDHFVEDNSAVQDHAASRPKVVMLSGFVGELTFRPENDALGEVRKAFEKLVTLDAYLPPLTDFGQQAKNIIQGEREEALETSLEDVANLYATIKNLNPGANKQQQAYLYFEALRKQRILMSVQTPYEFLTNMLIESLVVKQGQDSEQISEFTVTLKQIRFVDLTFTDFNIEKYKGRTKTQRETEENKGKAQGQKSALATFLDAGSGFLDNFIGE